MSRRRNIIPPNTPTAAAMLEEARLRKRLLAAGWTCEEMPGGETLWMHGGCAYREAAALEVAREMEDGK